MGEGRQEGMALIHSTLRLGERIQAEREAKSLDDCSSFILTARAFFVDQKRSSAISCLADCRDVHATAMTTMTTTDEKDRGYPERVDYGRGNE